MTRRRIILSSLAAVAVVAVALLARLMPSEARAAADTPTSSLATLPTVGVVLSYGAGYPWQDQILAGMAEVLDGRANYSVHEMDTLGVSDPEELAQRGRDARAWVDRLDPDVLIVADDWAKELVADAMVTSAERPVVFCGVNWPATEHTIPRPGLYGMVEVSPMDRAFELLGGTTPDDRPVVILGADRPTDRAQSAGFRSIAEAHGFQAEAVLVTSFEEWVDAFTRAQQSAGLVYLLNNAGISGWSDREAAEVVRSCTSTLTVTEYDWMVPFTVIALTK